MKKAKGFDNKNNFNIIYGVYNVSSFRIIEMFYLQTL